LLEPPENLANQEFNFLTLTELTSALKKIATWTDPRCVVSNGSTFVSDAHDLCQQQYTKSMVQTNQDYAHEELAIGKTCNLFINIMVKTLLAFGNGAKRNHIMHFPLYMFV
jgi:hypothetical protein